MGGAVPLVEPELSPLSASKTRKTLNDGNVNDQVTSLGQRNPIDYPDQSAIDYLDHSQLRSSSSACRSASTSIRQLLHVLTCSQIASVVSSVMLSMANVTICSDSGHRPPNGISIICPTWADEYSDSIGGTYKCCLVYSIGVAFSAECGQLRTPSPEFGTRQSKVVRGLLA